MRDAAWHVRRIPVVFHRSHAAKQIGCQLAIHVAVDVAIIFRAEQVANPPGEASLTLTSIKPGSSVLPAASTVCARNVLGSVCRILVDFGDFSVTNQDRTTFDHFAVTDKKTRIADQPASTTFQIPGEYASLTRFVFAYVCHAPTNRNGPSTATSQSFADGRIFLLFPSEIA